MKKVSDIFINSKDLKKIIVQRIKKEKLCASLICRQAQVKPHSLLSWCKGDANNFKSEEIIKVMNTIGIDYHVVFILKNDIDYSQMKDKDKTGYEHEIDVMFRRFLKKLEKFDDLK